VVVVVVLQEGGRGCRGAFEFATGVAMSVFVPFDPNPPSLASPRVSQGAPLSVQS